MDIGMVIRCLAVDPVLADQSGLFTKDNQV